jgi:hypothetical protein
VDGRTSLVHGEIDPHRDGHRDETCCDRENEPAPFAQVAEVELLARLQPDHQEEQRHQATVHPVLQNPSHVENA